MTDHVIHAVEHAGADDGTVDFAKRVVQAVIAAAPANPRIHISLQSLTGVSSTFFNVIYSELAMALGAARVRECIEFTDMTKTQAMVAGRSRQAVLGA